MKKKLFSVTIKDCRVDTFASGGPGGQHQNKTQSGVRIVHEPSGAVGECRELRSQHQNKTLAFRRMAETKKFQTWARIEAARRMGKPTVEELVEQAMAPGNIRVEGQDEEGKWVPLE